MLPKSFVKAWLGFGRRDRVAILVLIGLLAIIYALPLIFVKDPGSVEIKEGSILKLAIDSLEQGRALDKKSISQNKTQGFSDEAAYKSVVIFSFDPNSLDETGWKKLGLNPRIIRTIMNYRNKGGKFQKPADLEKIWGLPKEFFEKVKDSIRIMHGENKTGQNNFPAHIPFEKKTFKPFIIDINLVDTTALIALPGIGSKLAQRIINYRDKLGGFYSVDQVGETYGLKDSVFQKIKSYLKLEASPKKMNINTITMEELKLHPYFKWNLANAIISYRNQHGDFKSLEEIKNISLIDDGIFKRIIHYLEL